MSFYNFYKYEVSLKIIFLTGEKYEARIGTTVEVSGNFFG